jgi:hypothetical protein
MTMVLPHPRRTSSASSGPVEHVCAHVSYDETLANNPVATPDELRVARRGKAFRVSSSRLGRSLNVLMPCSVYLINVTYIGITNHLRRSRSTA